MYIKKLLVLVALGCVLAFQPALAQQPPSWFSRYLKAEKADDMSVCVAVVNYKNSTFMVRLYGEAMDFLYRRDDFTLPYGETLGLVNFVIDGQPFNLAAVSFERKASDMSKTSQMMQLLVAKEEYSSILSALRYGTEFKIVFPNGDVYDTTLRGSSNAIAAASNCWSRNETGSLRNNPFGEESGEKPEANNPFESL